MSRASVVLWLAGASSSMGCYDWQIGAAPADGGDAARRDATQRPVEAAPPEAAPPREATSDSPAEHDVSAPYDAPGDVRGTSCDELHASVDRTRTEAKACASDPSGCTSHVPDQCGCPVFIAQAGSAAVATYESSVMALVSSGCPLGCPTPSCPPPQPTGAFCLAAAQPDGSVGEACTP